MSTGQRLRDDHARLEKLYRELLDAYHEAKWSLVQEAWEPFEAGLRGHMDAEEAKVFPALAKVDEAEVTALRAEHVEMRRLLGELGVAVQLHAVREDVAQALIDRLREHASREDRIAYAFADESLPGESIVNP